MSLAASRLFRRQRADDLRRVAEVLRNHAFCAAVDPLMSAAAQCQAGGRHGASAWEYQIEDLRFMVPEDCVAELGRSEPDGLGRLDIVLTVELAGPCETGDGEDPFEQLVVDMLLEGHGGDWPSERRAAWHLDRHLGDPLHRESLIHPLYHMQYGGDLLERWPVDGTRLVVNAPRIACLPMDGVLAVDFVLANFFSGKWYQLRDEPKYLHALLASQDVCWRFYAERMAGSWPLPHEADPLCQLWPQFVPRPQELIA